MIHYKRLENSLDLTEVLGITLAPALYQVPRSFSVFYKQFKNEFGTITVRTSADYEHNSSMDFYECRRKLEQQILEAFKWPPNAIYPPVWVEEDKTITPFGQMYNDRIEELKSWMKNNGPSCMHSSRPPSSLLSVQIAARKFK